MPHKFAEHVDHCPSQSSASSDIFIRIDSADQEPIRCC